MVLLLSCCVDDCTEDTHQHVSDTGYNGNPGQNIREYVVNGSHVSELLKFFIA